SRHRLFPVPDLLLQLLPLPYMAHGNILLTESLLSPVRSLQDILLKRYIRLLSVLSELSACLLLFLQRVDIRTFLLCKQLPLLFFCSQTVSLGNSHGLRPRYPSLLLACSVNSFFFTS